MIIQKSERCTGLDKNIFLVFKICIYAMFVFSES